MESVNSAAGISIDPIQGGLPVRLGDYIDRLAQLSKTGKRDPELETQLKEIHNQYREAAVKLAAGNTSIQLKDNWSAGPDANSAPGDFVFRKVENNNAVQKIVVSPNGKWSRVKFIDSDYSNGAERPKDANTHSLEVSLLNETQDYAKGGSIVYINGGSNSKRNHAVYNPYDETPVSPDFAPVQEYIKEAFDLVFAGNDESQKYQANLVDALNTAYQSRDRESFKEHLNNSFSQITYTLGPDAANRGFGISRLQVSDYNADQYRLEDLKEKIMDVFDTKHGEFPFNVTELKGLIDRVKTSQGLEMTHRQASQIRESSTGKSMNMEVLASLGDAITAVKEYKVMSAKELSKWKEALFNTDTDKISSQVSAFTILLGYKSKHPDIEIDMNKLVDDQGLLNYDTMFEALRLPDPKERMACFKVGGEILSDITSERLKLKYSNISE